MKLLKNRFGTLDITTAFKGMRKEQDFCVYNKDDNSDSIVIQSDTRIGRINLTTGVVMLCKPKPSGCYFPDLADAIPVDKVSKEDLQSINELISGKFSQITIQ